MLLHTVVEYSICLKLSLLCLFDHRFRLIDGHVFSEVLTTSVVIECLNLVQYSWRVILKLSLREDREGA